MVQLIFLFDGKTRLGVWVTNPGPPNDFPPQRSLPGGVEKGRGASCPIGPAHVRARSIHRCPFWLFWSQKIDGPGLPGGLIYQGNPSISPKRTPMVLSISVSGGAAPQPLRGAGGLRGGLARDAAELGAPHAHGRGSSGANGSAGFGGFGAEAVPGARKNGAEKASGKGPAAFFLSSS